MSFFQLAFLFSLAVQETHEKPGPNNRPSPIRATLSGAKTVEGVRIEQDGQKITKEGRLILRLPSESGNARAELLGMVSKGDDVELFLEVIRQRSNEPMLEHLVSVYLGKEGQKASLERRLVLYGGPGSQLRFFESPESQVRPLALFSIMRDTNESDVYLLPADRSRVGEPFQAYDYQFVDLNRDGVYELIAWTRFPIDSSCGFFVAGSHVHPQVFALLQGTYKKIWPESKSRQVMGLLCNLRENEALGFVVLERGRPSVADYRLVGNRFVCIARYILPQGKIPFWLSEDKELGSANEVVVHTATERKCQAGGTIDGPDTAAYRLGSLRSIPQ